MLAGPSRSSTGFVFTHARYPPCVTPTSADTVGGRLEISCLITTQNQPSIAGLLAEIDDHSNGAFRGYRSTPIRRAAIDNKRTFPPGPEKLPTAMHTNQSKRYQEVQLSDLRTKSCLSHGIVVLCRFILDSVTPVIGWHFRSALELQINSLTGIVSIWNAVCVWEVSGTNEFADWYDSLNAKDQSKIDERVELLAQKRPCTSPTSSRRDHKIDL
jgi:hypothetical protein